MRMSPPTGGKINPTGAGAPAGRWPRSVVIHGAVSTTSTIFSDMAPIAERTSSRTEPTSPPPTEIETNLVTVAARPDQSVVEAERLRDGVGHQAPIDIPDALTESQPVLPGAIESTTELVVGPTQTDEKPSEAKLTSILTAHLVTCEYCGASISKLRTYDIQIGSAMSQWASCPTCSSARRTSSVLIRPDRQEGLWFFPLQYLFHDLRGRRDRHRKSLFVDCSPVGYVVPLGQRIFREATSFSDLSKVKGRKYDVVEVPFLLETGLGLKQWLAAFNSNLGEHSVVHLITLRRPYSSRPNGTEGWAGARLENLVQFPSIRGVETLIERSNLRIVTTGSKVVAPLTARKAERLASAFGVELCWLLLLVCWAALIHTIRSGPAYQLSLKQVKNTAQISGKVVKENVTKAR